MSNSGNALRRGLGWACAGGLIGSLAIEMQVVRIFEMLPLFVDFLRIWRYFVLYVGLPMAAVALLVELTAQALRGENRVAGRGAATVVLGLGAGLAIAPGRVLARRPFSPSDGTIHAELVAVLLVCLLGGYLLSRFLVRERRPGPWGVAPVLLVFMLVGAARYLRLPEPRGDRAEIEAALRPTDRRVLLLGVDGATWRVIDPMLDRGELPNFARVIAEGARGTLQSTVSPIQPLTNSASGGMRSPVLWSTVISGREPKDHGILDMEVTFVPGLEEPLPFRLPIESDRLSYLPANAGMRRVKSLWQIFSEYGRTVGSVAWWPSWPIEDVNGFIVSDRYRGEIEGAGRVMPAELVERYGLPGLTRAFSVGNVFVSCDGDETDGTAIPQHVTNLFKWDNLAMVLGPMLAEGEEWDFLSIYVKGPDVAQHQFWEFHDPESVGGLRSAEVDYDPIEAVYRHVDDMLGSLLAVLDDSTDLIIISDHGAGPWEEEHGWILDLWSKGKARNLWSGNHRVEGVFMMWGPDIEAGTVLEDPVHLVDAAPTALYLMGFPLAEEMPGKARLDGVRREVLRNRPPLRVASYEVESRRSSFQVDPEMDEDLEAELRSLGYLN